MRLYRTIPTFGTKRLPPPASSEVSRCLANFSPRHRFQASRYEAGIKPRSHELYSSPHSPSSISPISSPWSYTHVAPLTRYVFSLVITMMHLNFMLAAFFVASGTQYTHSRLVSTGYHSTGHQIKPPAWCNSCGVASATPHPVVQHSGQRPRLLSTTHGQSYVAS